MLPKRILITGASGFVAPFLGERLAYEGHNVFYTARSSFFKCDLRDAKAVRRLLEKVKPDVVVHLAGASQTSESRMAIKSYIDNNVVATANVCEAFSRLPGRKTLLIASSGMVYGSASGRSAFSENSPVRPTTPYGASKLAAEQVANVYNSDRLRVYIARPFNHIGPRQKGQFVCAAFSDRIKKAKPGDEIQVGHLNAWRDFTDVRDIVEAYALIIKKQPKERVFVLGSGRLVNIGVVLRTLVKISGKRIRFKVRSDFSTSKSISRLASNPTLAKTVLKWKPKLSLEQSLRDLYWS